MIAYPLAIFEYLARVKKYNVSVNYRYVYANEVYRKIVTHSLETLPDLVVLSVAPAANLLSHGPGTEYVPLTLLPGITHRILTPAAGGAPPGPVDYGRYLFLRREPSTPQFYFDYLSRNSRKIRRAINLEHAEPHEIPEPLAQGDPDLRSISFFPHYDFNALYNHCRYLDVPGNNDNYSEVVLFAHRSFLQDRKRALALDIALRDAWWSLLTGREHIDRIAEALTGDPEYISFVRRFSGIDSMPGWRRDFPPH